MKRVLKITLIVIIIALLVTFVGFGIYLACIPHIPLDRALLDNTSKITRYFDVNGAEITSLYTGKNASFASISNISIQTRDAFLCTEDKRFYQHKGYDIKRIFAAGLKNISSRETEEGGSTITQQLAKNTHLSSKKTLTRKIQELRLAKKMEAVYSKDEILEKYLNAIYFGHNVYGIESAARFYFDTHASALTLPQSATLVAIINAPTRNSPINHPDTALTRRNLVLKNMLNQGKIQPLAYTNAVNSPIGVQKTETSTDYYLASTRAEIENLLHLSGNLSGCSVFTNFSPSEQKILASELVTTDVRNKAVLCNMEGQILASYSRDNTTVNLKRQPGSLIKPLAVYAPAIERGVLNAATPILDEETNFGGYKPRNYGHGHEGWLSARQALAHSNNIAAVKTMQMTGLDYSCEFANRLGLPVVNEDKALTLALGGMKYGISVENLVGAYAAIASDGQYRPASYVNKILSESGKLLYQHNSIPRVAMSSDTAHIVTDMMRTCALDGTASKLGSLPYQIAAKTGTVGYLDTDLNTDAYSASFTSQHALVVWYGSSGNEQHDALKAEMRGGTYPTITARNVYQALYRQGAPKDFNYRLQEIVLDKMAYEIDHKLVQAPMFLSPNETIIEKFGLRSRPDTARLVTPILKANVTSDAVVLTITGDRYADYQIIRYDALGSTTIPVGKLRSLDAQQVVYDYGRSSPSSVYQLVALYPDGNCAISDNIRVFSNEI